MIHLATSNSSGTSFHGTIINAIPNQLIKSLGPPTYMNSGDNKVTMEWVRELDNAEVFTIYDWKYFKTLDMEESIIWNIGGRNKEITDNAKNEIFELLNK